MKYILQAMSLFSLSGGLAMYAAVAHAQTAGTTSTDDTQLVEIVVRAQRVEQRLQDVPVAVTPVSGAELETKRLHDLPQLTLAVPSLDVTEDNTFVMRGIGSQIFSSNVDSSVGVMVDDISLGVPIFMSNAAFVDVDQVEALTGPQGLLFGRNASAGLINIITAKPKLNEYSGEANLEYDDRDTAPGGHFGLIATGILNMPTSSNSALRLNILESDQDPITDVIVNKSPNYQGNQKRLMGKVKWLWEPSSDVSVYLIGDYSHERGVGGIWEDTYRVTGAGGSDIAGAKADGVTPGSTNLYKGLSGAQFRSVDTGGIALTVEDKLSDELTLSNILGWRRYYNSYNLDVDNSSLPFVDVNGGIESYDQYSEELRLAYKGSRIDGQAGLYSFWSTNNGFTDFQGNGPFPGITNFVLSEDLYHLQGRSLAAYGQFNYHLTDELQFLAGGRLSHDHVAVSAIANPFTPLTYDPPLFGFINQLPFVLPYGPTNQDLDQGNAYTNFSYKTGLQYNVTPDAMLYATWGTGYKGPAEKTYVFSATENPYLRPETVQDLEVGIKSELFNKRLRVNVDGFFEKFKDFQVQAFDSAGFATLTNAPGVRATGVELDTSFKVTSALTLNYTATIQNSHFTDFPGDPCYTQQPTASCPNGHFFQGAGIQTPASARYHGTLEGIYTVPVGTAHVDFEANWYSRSSINFSAAGAPYQELGSINIFGASATYRTDNGVSASIFCKNCSNDVYPTYILADPLDGSAGVVSTFNRWGYNSVRTIGASIGYKF